MAAAKFGRKFLAVLLATFLLVTSATPVFAEIGDDIGGTTGADIGTTDGSDGESAEEGIGSGLPSGENATYQEIKAAYIDAGYKAGANKIVVFGTNEAGTFTDGNIKGEDESVVTIKDYADAKGVSRKALVWDYTEAGDASTNKNTGYTFEFTVESEGLYYLNFDYVSIAAANAEIARDVYIDGVLPFAEAIGVPLFKNYVENGEVTQTYVGDKYEGDDIRPSIVENLVWLNQSVYDNQYRESLPLQFYLSAGQHTLTLNFSSQPAVFSSISFIPANQPMSYSDYAAAMQAAGYKEGTGTFRIEGEDCDTRSSSGVRREYNTDPSSSDYSYSRKVLNTVGGANWNEGGEAASWTCTVETAGLYRIGFRYEQSGNEGLPSFRQLTINGEIPFAEAEAIAFDFGNNLQDMTIGEKDVDGGYLFYLQPGDVITLTVVMGEYADCLRELEDIVDTIMDLYSTIRVITGADPDSNYDYGLERFIPTLDKDLNDIRLRLLDVCDRLYMTEKEYEAAVKEAEANGEPIPPKPICTTRPGMVSNFRSIAEDFEKWRKEPLLIPGDMDDITGNATNITTYVTTMKSQQLEIDVIYVAPTKDQYEKKVSHWYDRLFSFFNNLWLSFMKDYTQIGITSGENENIDVWVGRGTEYCEILREMLKKSFTEETGIGVSINILPSGQLSASGTNLLMLSYISGNAPDLVLGGGANDAIEFAIRDAMFPLEGFEDFEEVKGRFYPAMFDACEYQGHYYALPETMSFMAMFYRTDIFEKLGLDVPTTWDELYGDVIPVLYENDMQFWYAGGYDLILYQYGGSFYRDDYDENGVLQKNIRTGLDTDVAYEAFVEYTDMYNVQGMPVTINFYNQFRYGDVPIGIADFGTYMQFLIAAPEIAGKWDLAPIPQSVLTDENGNEYLSQATTGLGGNYCFIMDNVTNGKYDEEKFASKAAAAWEFMKWWTRADIQTEYGAEVEAVIGRDARWLSSNIEAFKNSAWEGNHLNIILESQEMAVVTPNVLGGYYTGRHVTNAFNRTVVARDTRARDSLIQSVKDINKEIWAKRTEYNTGVPADASTLS